MECTRIHDFTGFEPNLITSDSLQGSRKSYVKIKKNVKKNVLTGYENGHSHCLQNMHQLWKGIAQNYMDRFL